MRLFVALDLPDQARNAITDFTSRMRRCFPAAHWVRVEGIHVTLKFIGEVSEDLWPPITEALARVKSAAPVNLEFSGTGFFPDAKRPRVLWISIQASPNLTEIAANIDARLGKLGIPQETREFRPHLTLARLDNTRGIEKLHAALQGSSESNFGSLRTGEMHLYQSELGKGGARYTRLKTFWFTSPGPSA
jgi:RNA 2',3'-cyclic 3'-phosphodiesterase